MESFWLAHIAGRIRGEGRRWAIERALTTFLAPHRATEADRRAAVFSNNRRLFVASTVAVPVHLAHVLIFWLTAPAGDPQEEAWRAGILYAHGVLTGLMVLFAAVSFFLKGANPAEHPSLTLWMKITQHLAIFTVLLAGVVIAAIDQLVRDEMTPFLSACVIVAIVFLLPPAQALLTYGLAYALFFYVMGQVQPNEVILLSNRVNGITAIGVGFGLSIILWTGFLRDARQQERIEQQQEEIRRKNTELARLAAIDPLTGLMNRRSFEEVVAVEVARLRRQGGESCLVIVDVDHFKRFNDRYGHLAGDEMLRAFARLLTAHVRRHDLVARWGGEEFLILLPGTTLEEARAIAERLRVAIEQNPDSCLPAPVTASFGMARLDPSVPEPFVESYRQADQALYAAKKAGRNQVRVGMKEPAGSVFPPPASSLSGQ